MVLARITKSTIESVAYNNIFETINTRSYVADPRDPGGTDNREFVYDSDPFHKAINFSDFPYIILNLPETVEPSQESVNSDTQRKSWKQTIIVRTVKDGSSGTRANQGRTDLLNIGDDLHETFENSTVEYDLGSTGIFHLKLVKVGFDTDVIDQQTVYESEYELTYSMRLIVD